MHNKIYPRSVKGNFRQLKWYLTFILLAIYYIAPWLRWQRGENLPNQALMIDLPHNRAYFFDLIIWPQDVVYVAGILILAAIALFLVTSLFGRIWCGYACPQTIWTDLFIWVERKIQGDRTARMRLDQAPWHFEKIIKKTATHLIWLLIGLMTGGAWVLYFNDALQLSHNIWHGELSKMQLGWIIGLTFSTYIMAGYGRQKVCSHMCPYARFQSAMFDQHTLIIGYDQERGEPRGKHKKGDSWENKGHCIDCQQCVVVCPQGIDIRNGLQMECIACGLCIDACNDVMHKLDLPPGLIRYDTEHNLEHKNDKLRFLRPRVIYYLAIIAIAIGLMAYRIASKADFTAHIIHQRDPLYIILSNGEIRNAYELKIANKTTKRAYFSVTISPAYFSAYIPGHELELLSVPAEEVANYRLLITANDNNIKKEEPITVTIETNGHREKIKDYFIKP